MSTVTVGKKIFDEHMAYLNAGDIEGMVRDQYTPDAVMISPYDILPTSPPHVLTSHQAIVDFFKKWAGHMGELSFDSDIEAFAETPDSVSFQFKFTSKNTGKWFEGLAWYIVDGKIHRQYGFATKLG